MIVIKGTPRVKQSGNFCKRDGDLLHCHDETKICEKVKQFVVLNGFISAVHIVKVAKLMTVCC